MDNTTKITDINGEEFEINIGANGDIYIKDISEQLEHDSNTIYREVKVKG